MTFFDGVLYDGMAVVVPAAAQRYIALELKLRRAWGKRQKMAL